MLHLFWSLWDVERELISSSKKITLHLILTQMTKYLALPSLKLQILIRTPWERNDTLTPQRVPNTWAVAAATTSPDNGTWGDRCLPEVPEARVARTALREAGQVPAGAGSTGGRGGRRSPGAARAYASRHAAACGRGRLLRTARLEPSAEPTCRSPPRRFWWCTGPPLSCTPAWGLGVGRHVATRLRCAWLPSRWGRTGERWHPRAGAPTPARLPRGIRSRGSAWWTSGSGDSTQTITKGITSFFARLALRTGRVPLRPFYWKPLSSPPRASLAPRPRGTLSHGDDSTTGSVVGRSSSLNSTTTRKTIISPLVQYVHRRPTDGSIYPCLFYHINHNLLETFNPFFASAH